MSSSSAAAAAAASENDDDGCGPNEFARAFEDLCRRRLKADPEVSIEHLRQQVDMVVSSLDKNRPLLSDGEREALLTCSGRKGGELMERLIILGLAEHGTCALPHETVTRVSYTNPPSPNSRAKNVTEMRARTLFLKELRSFDALSKWLRVPLKIASERGRGSDIFFLKTVDAHRRQVHFVLIESKFGTTTLDGGHRGGARGNVNTKSTRSENRMMPKILEKLRHAATSLRTAIVGALGLDDEAGGQRSCCCCTFELVLACGSPINGPAREVLAREHAYSIQLWDHAYLWEHVWERRVKAFLLQHYNNDERRARYLHVEYKEASITRDEEQQGNGGGGGGGDDDDDGAKK